MTPKHRSRKGGEDVRPTSETDLPESREGEAPEGAALRAQEHRAALELEQRLRALQTEFESAALAWREREDALLRQLAERENQIRRLKRDREAEVELQRGRLVEPLITVLDDFERALEHRSAGGEEGFADGVAQIAARLRETLLSLGLRPIEALGRKFDPALHEAMMQVESEDVAKGHVALEMQKGYLLGDRVLRPTKVAVSS